MKPYIELSESTLYTILKRLETSGMLTVRTTEHDDRMEEGLTEEDAVAEIGTAEEIAAQIIAETPITKFVREKIRPKKALGTWEIVFLILGSPIWLSLLIAAGLVCAGLTVFLFFGCRVATKGLFRTLASGRIATKAASKIAKNRRSKKPKTRIK